MSYKVRRRCLALPEDVFRSRGSGLIAAAIFEREARFEELATGVEQMLVVW